MAWRWTGDKPLPEPMLIQFTDAYIRHEGGGVWVKPYEQLDGLMLSGLRIKTSLRCGLPLQLICGLLPLISRLHSKNKQPSV